MRLHWASTQDWKINLIAACTSANILPLLVRLMPGYNDHARARALCCDARHRRQATLHENEHHEDKAKHCLEDLWGVRMPWTPNPRSKSSLAKLHKSSRCQIEAGVPLLVAPRSSGKSNTANVPASALLSQVWLPSSPPCRKSGCLPQLLFCESGR